MKIIVTTITVRIGRAAKTSSPTMMAAHHGRKNRRLKMLHGIKMMLWKLNPVYGLPSPLTSSNPQIQHHSWEHTEQIM